MRETEQYHIDFIKPSLNQVRAFGRNYDMYKRNNNKNYRTNREERLEKAKQYRQKNKDRISEKQKEKITCECGKTYTKHHKTRHNRSNKHQKYIQSLSSSLSYSSTLKFLATD